jgi:putative endonuclease
MIGEEPLCRLRSFWDKVSRKGFEQIEVTHNWSTSLLRTLDRKLLGKLGENIVSKWAQLDGFVILHRSFRHTGFELDLVIQRDSWINILEVKTRLNPSHAPDMNITQGWINKRKRSALLRGMTFLSDTISDGIGSVETITIDLVAIDIYDFQRKIKAYRWPNVICLKD